MWMASTLHDSQVDCPVVEPEEDTLDGEYGERDLRQRSYEAFARGHRSTLDVLGLARSSSWAHGFSRTASIVR